MTRRKAGENRAEAARDYQRALTPEEVIAVRLGMRHVRGGHLARNKAFQALAVRYADILLAPPFTPMYEEIQRILAEENAEIERDERARERDREFCQHLGLPPYGEGP